MATNLKRAQDLLFGKDGLGVANFKMFPGSSREATPEDIAGELVASIEALLKGELEEITVD